MDFTFIPAATMSDGTALSSGSRKSVRYEAAITCQEEAWQGAADAFGGYVEKVHGLSLQDGEGGIVLVKEEGIPAGGYRLDCGDTALTIRSSDLEGINRGLGTVLQGMQPAQQEGCLLFPDVSLQDAPDSSHRGLLVDVARQWHPLSYLYDYVDLCYLYKINRLQLHFTDEQSYTLPSDSYPLLPTENRHYTKEEIQGLVEYAHQRGVMLVPEIEVPGHSGQFLAKYPDVFGTMGILCCEEKVFEALDKIFGELCELFPYSDYIHIGGDEAAIANWARCPGCRQYLKEHDLKGTDGLYVEFVDRVTRIILEKGRTPIVWEGFPEEGNDKISKDVIVIGWESYYQSPVSLLEAGFQVINASWQPLYIVTPGTSWSQEHILGWNIHKWEHWWENSMAYPDGIQVDSSANVIGGQLCAWGDVLSTYEDYEKGCQEEFALIRERIPALSERTWNVSEVRQYEEFSSCYERLNTMLDAMLS